MPQHTVCRTDELEVGQMKTFVAGGQKILLFRLDDGFYATQTSCTHMLAPLGRGKVLDGCKVQCPLHRARFDIKTGEVLDWANFPPGIQALNFVRGEKALKTYQVSVKGHEVRVAVD